MGVSAFLRLAPPLRSNSSLAAPSKLDPAELARAFFAALEARPVRTEGRLGGDGCVVLTGEFGGDAEARSFVARCVGRSTVVGLTLKQGAGGPRVDVFVRSPRGGERMSELAPYDFHDPAAMAFFESLGFSPHGAVFTRRGDGATLLTGEFKTDLEARAFVARCVGRPTVTALTYYSWEEDTGPTVTVTVRSASSALPLE